MSSRRVQIKRADLSRVQSEIAEKFGDNVEVTLPEQGLGRPARLGQIELVEIIISVVATVSLEEVISFVKAKISEGKDKSKKIDEDSNTE